MRNIFGILIFLFLNVSCQQKIGATDINKLNGYWEIEKVVLPNNDNKDYKINETIDFFKINNKTGFRHKVTPQFNGKYLVNEFAENVKIVQNEDKTYLEYSTQFAKWKDELISINDDKMVVRNDANIEYHYKKQIPFSVK